MVCYFNSRFFSCSSRRNHLNFAVFPRILSVIIATEWAHSFYRQTACYVASENATLGFDSHVSGCHLCADRCGVSDVGWCDPISDVIWKWRLDACNELINMHTNFFFAWKYAWFKAHHFGVNSSMCWDFDASSHSHSISLSLSLGVWRHQRRC